ncbi:MAG: Biopolymer transport protein [Acidobacteria bacterium]|nr:Biopolymer transport protein [Acidobacteriota bacterium]
MNKPNINVTPLIDVLLVLLIIFMVVSPLKPSAFEAKIPQEPKITDNARANEYALVVELEPDSSLRLNREKDLGTADDSEKLVEKLKRIFKEREENGVYAENFAANNNSAAGQMIEKTVFIKAPRSADYGSVAKVIDAVKVSGANPISLQIDRLQ